MVTFDRKDLQRVSQCDFDIPDIVDQEDARRVLYMNDSS